MTVNGVPAKRAGNAFAAEVLLQEKETDIVAVAEGGTGRREHRVRVVWDRHSRPRYRFSIDDNSFFLRDIAQKNYASLFDCFYLKMLRDLHAKYGAKFIAEHLLHDRRRLQPAAVPRPLQGRVARQRRLAEAGLPRLRQRARPAVPGRPAGEADRRPRPGGRADPPLCRRGDLRPADGDPLGHGPAGGLQAALRAGRPRAQRLLRHASERLCDVNYRWTTTAPSTSPGTTPGRISTAASSSPGSTSSATTCRVDQIVRTLEPLAKDPNTAEIMDLFTHEQYFWPFYRNYLPDHPQRLDAAIRWVTEHGYKPVFFHEGFLGIKD